MKIQIITDEGILIETIEDAQEYDLSKPVAKAMLCEQIKDALERGKLEENPNE